MKESAKDHKHISKLILGSLKANCYILSHEENCIIIDPADEADYVLELVSRKKLKPLALIATHGHFDHIMAVGGIQLSKKIPLFINYKDLFLLKRLNETAQHFLGYDPGIQPPLYVQKLQKETFSIGTFDLELIPTPGHTPGSMSFYLEDEDMLFTGDTLFHQGIGRYDFSYGDYKKLQKSIQTLCRFPDHTKVYPGHGEITTIGDEKEFLRENNIIKT